MSFSVILLTDSHHAQTRARIHKPSPCQRQQRNNKSSTNPTQSVYGNYHTTPTIKSKHALSVCLLKLATLTENNEKEIANRSDLVLCADDTRAQRGRHPVITVQLLDCSSWVACCEAAAGPSGHDACCCAPSWATWRPKRRQVRPGSTWRCAPGCRSRRRTGTRSGTERGTWRGRVHPWVSATRTRPDSRRWSDTERTPGCAQRDSATQVSTTASAYSASAAAAAADKTHQIRSYNRDLSLAVLKL